MPCTSLRVSVSGEGTWCAVYLLKDSLLLFFQAYGTAGNHENIQDFLQIQGRRICLWRIGSVFIP